MGRLVAIPFAFSVLAVASLAAIISQDPKHG